jgi:hypothetical protein
MIAVVFSIKPNLGSPFAKKMQVASQKLGKPTSKPSRKMTMILMNELESVSNPQPGYQAKNQIRLDRLRPLRVWETPFTMDNLYGARAQSSRLRCCPDPRAIQSGIGIGRWWVLLAMI